MCSADESTTSRWKNVYIAHTLVALIIEMVGFAASLVYCLKFISIDFAGATFGFMTAIGGFGIIYVLIDGIRMRHQIDNIFTSLLKIYKSSKLISIFFAISEKLLSPTLVFSIYENEATFEGVLPYFVSELHQIAATGILFSVAQLSGIDAIRKTDTKTT